MHACRVPGYRNTMRTCGTVQLQVAAKTLKDSTDSTMWITLFSKRGTPVYVRK